MELRPWSEIKHYPKIDGWHIDGETAFRVRVGEGVSAGAKVLVGDEAQIGDGVTICDCASIGERVVIEARAMIGVYVEIHDEAFVGESVRVSRGAKVGANATLRKGSRIGESARIERGALISEGVVIHRFARIGEGAKIEENVLVEEHAAVGTKALVYKGAHIGAHAHVGAYSLINCDAIVGEGARVSNSVCVGNGVNVGEHACVGSYSLLRNGSEVPAYAAVGDQALLCEGARVGSINVTAYMTQASSNVITPCAPGMVAIGRNEKSYEFFESMSDEEWERAGYSGDNLAIAKKVLAFFKDIDPHLFKANKPAAEEAEPASNWDELPEEMAEAGFVKDSVSYSITVGGTVINVFGPVGSGSFIVSTTHDDSRGAIIHPCKTLNDACAIAMQLCKTQKVIEDLSVSSLSIVSSPDRGDA